MTNLDPPNPDENTIEPEKRGWCRRLLSRRALVFLLTGLIVVYWQRQQIVSPVFERIIDSHLKNRDQDRAEWWLGIAHTIVPADPAMAILKAKIARQRGDMAGVSAALKTASGLGASRKELERQQWLAMAQSGQMRDAEPHLAELLTDRSHDNREVCEAYVIGFIRSHRTDAAMRLLTSWIADAPDDATPRLLKARIQGLLSLPRDAEQNYLAAIELQPHWIEPRLELAELLVKQKRYADARTYLTELLDNEAFAERVRIGLAECLSAEGDSVNAIKMLKAACQTQNPSADAYMALGRAFLENGDYEEAVNTLETAIELRPNDDESHYLLARALSLNGQNDRAEIHFQIVTTAREALQELDKINNELLTDPHDAVKLIRAGEILMLHGDPAEGVVRIMTGLDIEPENEKGLSLLAEHYTQKAATDSNFRDLATTFQDRLSKAKAATQD